MIRRLGYFSTIVASRTAINAQVARITTSDHTDTIPDLRQVEEVSEIGLSQIDTEVGLFHKREEGLWAASPEVLVNWATHYLRATTNPKLVSLEEEHAIFPVIAERLNELHVQQLLDIVECHWARSTLVRYGTDLKDQIRDRIAQIATAASAAIEKGAQHDGGEGEEDGNDNDDLYVHENEAKEQIKQCDPILAAAEKEMTPETVWRCIIVMGMSAGRRKRDLEFFQAMGIFFTHHINAYKDPHDLVRVLTAFTRAKILPSQSFLSLLTRRFPILNKKTPLEPLPCYRAMVNYARMGYDNITPYRFLADCMLLRIEEKLADERRGGDHLSSPSLLKHMSTSSQAKERLHVITGMKPSMFTRWLSVLAKYGAPHQQYLRPLVEPLVVPMIPHLPPPSFTRLLVAMRLFKTSDKELLEPILEYVCSELAPNDLLFPVDARIILSILAQPDVQPLGNLKPFFQICYTMFAAPLEDVKLEGASLSKEKQLLLHTLQPVDMCRIANNLLQLQRNTDIPLDTVTPLTLLVEKFAERFIKLMDLRVVSLPNVDVFLQICAQLQHPDDSGFIEKLSAYRQRVECEGGDEEYYSSLDIDVRETLHKILVVNGTNTFGEYRPLPGEMQVDFKAALNTVSATDILEAVNLHERVSPGGLRKPSKRILSRSILAKLNLQGEEEVINTERNIIEMKKPAELYLTRSDLRRFKELVDETPLAALRKSPVTWHFIFLKAKRLGDAHVEEEATEVLRKIATD